MTSNPAWVADPSVEWIIVLHASLARAVDAGQVRAGAIATGLQATLVDAEGRSGLDAVVAPGEAPLRVALSDKEVWLGVEHRHCDGIGLLALLGQVAGAPATSSARGIGTRRERGTSLGATCRRLAEALFAPPAPVAAHRPRRRRPRVPGDAFARLTLPGHVSTAALVEAAVSAVADHNRAAGARTSRIAVSIGASRSGGGDPVVSDDSALLRLQHVERMNTTSLQEAMRRAAPEPPPPGARRGTGPVAWGSVAAMRLLSPRLGSTLLVSHLGTVDAPGVEDLAFYPVTAGGSGISVGAVGLRGTTVVTLRGRRHRHGPDLLEALGRRVRDALSPAGS
jgi:hypothetical protein